MQHLYELAAAKAVRFSLVRGSHGGAAGADGADAEEAAAGSAGGGGPFHPASLQELRDAAATAGVSIGVTALGPAHIMSRHYLRFTTLKLFGRVQPDAKPVDALRTLCHAFEVIGNMVLRRDEKKVRGAMDGVIRGHRCA
jgi:hypothetical protein